MFLLSPKSCPNPWSESGDREFDLGELTRGLLFIPRAQVLTGLTGADPLLGFARVNVLVSSHASLFAAISSFECF